MWKAAKNKLSRSSSSRSTRSNASRASSDMQVDEPPTTRAAPSSSTTMINVMMEEKNTKLRNHQEKDKYKKLKDHEIKLTSIYYPRLLQDTGMNTEFQLIFDAVGWGDFWQVTEAGSKFLTAQFLCTQKVTDTGVEFRLFGKEFTPSWK